MVDLALMAAFFRAVNWASVQRLILVGDPNQLPPIGRGRVFADVIDWLKDHKPENVGVLATNMRQMENRLAGRGTGILGLASLYVRDESKEDLHVEEARAEAMLRRVQEGGEVDSDLRVVYWQDANDLEEQLTVC
jgi:exodeoxyribonuclease V alpha subunit